MATMKDAEGWAEGLGLTVKRQAIIGSTYIFGEGADVDVLLEVDNLEDVAAQLALKGWDVAVEYEITDDWFAARKGLVNLLVCSDTDHYCNMLGAAWVCRALYLVGKLEAWDKDTRVIIHRALTGEAQTLGGMVFEHGESHV